MVRIVLVSAEGQPYRCRVGNSVSDVRGEDLCEAFVSWALARPLAGFPVDFASLARTVQPR